MNPLISFPIILLLILANGLFVAAEFAIIGVRPSRLEQLAEEGSRTARWLYNIVSDDHNINRYIATSQLGITLASLGLGMYGEPAIAHLIEDPLHDWFGLEEAAIHTISFFFALGLITYLHVVLGEMVPKSLALTNPERMAFNLASPMHLMERIFAVPVAGLNGFGALLLRLLRIPPASEGSRLYTSDDLALIVSESYEGGLIEDHEQQIASRIFDFSGRRVSQVMTPRTLMTAVPVTIKEQDLLDLIATSGNSRLPVYEDSIDHVIGILHLKDVVRQQLSGEPFDIRALLREVIYVPGMLSIEPLLDVFKQEHLHMAIVLDEHGGTQGLVTFEDLIEEVIGEVRDEFDSEEAPPLTVVAPGHIEAQGAVLIETIEEYVSLGKTSYDVQTIGGMVLAALSRFPKVGDEVTINQVTIRVEEVEGMTIKRVSLRFPPPGESGEDG